MKICSKCKIKERYSTSSYCKQCHNSHLKEYFKKNNYKYQKEYQKRTRYAVKLNRKVNGWTEELYEETFKKQNFKCAICKTDKPSPNNKNDWHADHNHTTGEPRGILCSSCNTLLGRIENREKDWFEKAKKYLGWK